MSLPEDKPEVVEAFIARIYEQNLAGGEQWGNANYLTDMYIFADSKQCNSLKDAVLAVWQDAHDTKGGGKSRFGSTHMEKIFSNTEKIGNEGIWRYCAAWCHYELMCDLIVPQELTARFASCPGLPLEYFKMQHYLEKKLVESKGALKTLCSAYPAGSLSDYFGKCYFHTHGELDACTITGDFGEEDSEDEETPKGGS